MFNYKGNNLEQIKSSKYYFIPQYKKDHSKIKSMAYLVENPEIGHYPYISNRKTNDKSELSPLGVYEDAIIIE